MPHNRLKYRTRSDPLQTTQESLRNHTDTDGSNTRGTIGNLKSHVVHADALFGEVGVVQLADRPSHVVPVGELSHTAPHTRCDKKLKQQHRREQRSTAAEDAHPTEEEAQGRQ